MISAGKVKDQKVLAQYYSMADLTVVTSKRETFNMPVAESLACGTPVIGFKAGGPETISIKEYSEFVDYGDIEALASCARKWLNFKNKNSADISKAADERYSKEKMCERYLEVYKSMLEKISK
jgi:glycosyltransferase involved in cell wall biosynthesis